MQGKDEEEKAGLLIESRHPDGLFEIAAKIREEVLVLVFVLWEFYPILILCALVSYDFFGVCTSLICVIISGLIQAQKDTAEVKNADSIDADFVVGESSKDDDIVEKEVNKVDRDVGRNKSARKGKQKSVDDEEDDEADLRVGEMLKRKGK